MIYEEEPEEEINQIFDKEPVQEEDTEEEEVKVDNELKEEIIAFSDYLDREYEALYPIVYNNEMTRDSKKVDQEVQTELERRLDIVDYIRNLFQSRIEKFFK